MAQAIRMITAKGLADIKAGRRLWVTPHKLDCEWMLGAARNVQFVRVLKSALPSDHPICGTCGS
jgi:DNA-binding FadR family transcriptional regulator